MRIIAVPQTGTQAVTCLVLVGTGSKYENKKISGISHLLEHLLFKGTQERPTHLEIAEPLDRVGGVYNAFTGEDYTGYFAKVDAKHFDLALDIISDIYLNSKLDSKEIAKEKSVVIEEINMYYDHPTSHVQELWSKLLYGDQPAGWSIAGTKESVAGIKREDLLSYMKAQYSASNTIICVAGSIPKIGDAVVKIEDYFSKIENKKILAKPKVLEKQEIPQCLIENRKTDQTHLCLGVRGYSMFHSRKYALELLGLILGGMMSSRLFASVREKLGLAYYIRTNVSLDPDSGFLVTQAGIDNSRVEKAISAILKEYKRISEYKVSKDELNKVKDHIKGKMVLLFEASDELASFYGMQDLLEKKILSPEEIYKEIDKVTANDILEVSQDVFRSDKLNLSLIGPFKGEKQFYKILKL